MVVSEAYVQHCGGNLRGLHVSRCHFHYLRIGQVKDLQRLSLFHSKIDNSLEEKRFAVELIQKFLNRKTVSVALLVLL